MHGLACCSMLLRDVLAEQCHTLAQPRSCDAGRAQVQLAAPACTNHRRSADTLLPRTYPPRRSLTVASTSRLSWRGWPRPPAAAGGAGGVRCPGAAGARGLGEDGKHTGVGLPRRPPGDYAHDPELREKLATHRPRQQRPRAPAAPGTQSPQAGAARGYLLTDLKAVSVAIVRPWYSGGPPRQPNASSRALPAGPAVASGGSTPVTVLSSNTLQYVSYVPREPAGPCVVGGSRAERPCPRQMFRAVPVSGQTHPCRCLRVLKTCARRKCLEQDMHLTA